MSAIHCPKCQAERGVAVPAACPHSMEDTYRSDLRRAAEALVEEAARIVKIAEENEDGAAVVPDGGMLLTLEECVDAYRRAQLALEIRGLQP